MRLWAIVWAVVLAAIGAFSIVNWPSLMIPVSLNFLVAEVSAPLGVVMLGAMASLMLLFLLFLVWLETKALLQIGRVNARAGTDGPLRDVVLRLERVEEMLKDGVTRARSSHVAEADVMEREVRRVG